MVWYTYIYTINFWNANKPTHQSHRKAPANWWSEPLDKKWDTLAQDAEQEKTSYWKAANTCLETPSPKSNLALNRNGKTLVSDKEKASGFTEIYGGIYSPAPDTDHETAVEDTWNRISEKQFRYEDDDYT